MSPFCLVVRLQWLNIAGMSSRRPGSYYPKEGLGKLLDMDLATQQWAVLFLTDLCVRSLWLRSIPPMEASLLMWLHAYKHTHTHRILPQSWNNFHQIVRDTFRWGVKQNLSVFSAIWEMMALIPHGLLWEEANHNLIGLNYSLLKVNLNLYLKRFFCRWPQSTDSPGVEVQSWGILRSYLAFGCDGNKAGHLL